MSEANLFGVELESTKTGAPERNTVKPAAPPKLLRAERKQVLLVPTDLESLLPEDHVARGMWELAGKLDLSRFLSAIETLEDEAGRPAIDPRILVTLWLFATSEGVGSARELSRGSAGYTPRIAGSRAAFRSAPTRSPISGWATRRRSTT